MRMKVLRAAGGSMVDGRAGDDKTCHDRGAPREGSIFLI